MFAQYEEEFEEVTSELRRKLGKGLSDGKSVAKVEELLRQACDLSKQMDVEARSSDDRKALTARVKPVKEAVKELQAKVRETTGKVEREKLLGGVDAESAAAEGRARTVDANDRARRQNQVLRGAIEVAQETEQVALDITDELGRNRETIASIHDHVRDTGDTIGAARGLIASMQKRDVQQKFVLMAVGTVLFFGISGFVYFMW
mmetsp:Transcript_12854/g.41987  ORF Transcript_12854/g.41987 Transcript_12854/m.41987 type:complete len:204 (-) Transcript_12854:294-905(-)|eukprot:CAMPEP_0118896224 /NCGR_PEP_ID=MMETSP1166-20130328/4197_1 /TAXON_ID=1104430 /ORGANISM="Chrysoreinhardia sp, Strain CCMP3193" /LENGTH=203 /DNA_ID=CAMNT_0006835277 /DNA_START=47 /DNA_END=658 /DNA_ORIENTATION=+